MRLRGRQWGVLGYASEGVISTLPYSNLSLCLLDDKRWISRLSHALSPAQSKKPTKHRLKPHDPWAKNSFLKLLYLSSDSTVGSWLPRRVLSWLVHVESRTIRYEASQSRVQSRRDKRFGKIFWCEKCIYPWLLAVCSALQTHVSKL